jgi:hypothetical protein
MARASADAYGAGQSDSPSLAAAAALDRSDGSRENQSCPHVHARTPRRRHGAIASTDFGGSGTRREPSAAGP